MPSVLELDHPSTLAQEIARLLESDPVAVRQVKEHIKQERLIELFEIQPPSVDKNDVEEVLDSVAIEDDGAVLKWIAVNFSKSEILAAFKK